MLKYIFNTFKEKLTALLAKKDTVVCLKFVKNPVAGWDRNITSRLCILLYLLLHSIREKEHYSGSLRVEL